MTAFTGLGAKRSTILIVDDDNSVLDLLYMILAKEGYELLTADNGPDGLRVCRQSVHPIQLLVTDYNMPLMSGLELARGCTRLFGEIKVLYVSGSGPDADLQVDLKAPNRDFLAKPFCWTDLVRKTKELLLPEAAGEGKTQDAVAPSLAQFA